LKEDTQRKFVHVNIGVNHGDIKTVIYSTILKEDVSFNYFPITDFIPRTVVETKEEATYSNSWGLNDGENLLDIIKEESRVALLGEAGLGKSTELKFLYNELLREGHFIPFHINLKSYEKEDILSLKPEILSFKDAEKKVVLLIDGLDEPSEQNIRVAINKISSFSNNIFSNCKIVVSCRTNFYEDSLDNFKSYYLKDLYHHQAQEFAKLKLGNNSQLFINETYQKGLSGLILIPFYLVKIIEYFQENNNSIPNNKAELFKKLIEKSIESRFKKNTSLSNDEKGIQKTRCEELLKKLAFVMQCLSVSSISRKQVLEIIGNEEDMDLLQKSSSVLEVLSDSWQFSHLNFQEYLAGCVLLKFDFPRIKKTIGIKSLKYRMTKPSWLNTISFFVDLVDSKPALKEQIVSWLEKDEPQLLFKFESNRLPIDLKERLVIQICSNHKQQNKKFDHNYSLPQMSSFIETEKTYTFLLNEVQSKNIASSINAFELLFYRNKESIPNTVLKKLYDIIWSILKSEEKNERILRWVLNIYLNFYERNEKEIEFIVEKFFLESSYLRPLIISIIHVHKWQDKFIDECIIELSEQVNSNKVVSFPNPLIKVFENLKKEESIERYMTFYVEHHEKITDVHLDEILQGVLSCALKVAPNNPIVFESVNTIIKKTFWRPHNIRSENPFLVFLDKANLKFKMLKSIFESSEELEYNLFSQLIYLADSLSLKYLALKFNELKVEEEKIHFFRNFLSRTNMELGLHFESYINQDREEKIKFHEIPTKDEENAKKIESINRAKKILFDKNAFIEDVEIIFGEAEELTYRELLDMWKIQLDPKLNSSYILNILVDKARAEIIKKEEFLDRVNNHWECCFIIYDIDKFLENHKEAELKENELKFVKDWCDNKIQDVNFQTAFTRDGNSYSRKRLEIFVAKQIIKFNFIHYREELYLDLLSMVLGLSEDVSFFDFTENVKQVPFERIKQRVFENLSKGIEVEEILKNHIKFCVQKNLKESTKLIFEHLKNNNFHSRFDVLDAYLELDGNISELENLLKENLIQGNFKFNLAWKLVELNSPRIEAYLKKEFTLLPEEQKVKYAKLLLSFDNKEAFKFLESHIIETGGHPFSYENELKNLKLPDSISHLLRLLKLKYTHNILQQDRFDLADLALDGISSITLIEDNFKPAKRRINTFILKNQLFRIIPNSLREKFKIKVLDKKTIKSLKENFARIEKIYYIEESKTITIKGALSLLNT
jgi:hypothetical protein